MTKITDEIVNQCIGLINSNENQIKLRCMLIDPIFNYVASKAVPYFISLTILLIVNVCLLLVVIYFLTKPGLTS